LLSAWEQVRSHVLCVFVLYPVVTSCRAPFFDHRRRRKMQAPLHPEAVENKQTEQQRPAAFSAK
jgi:hypothetical protein